jgi:hypothetical protein
MHRPCRRVARPVHDCEGSLQRRRKAGHCRFSSIGTVGRPGDRRRSAPPSLGLRRAGEAPLRVGRPGARANNLPRPPAYRLASPPRSRYLPGSPAGRARSLRLRARVAWAHGQEARGRRHWRTFPSPAGAGYWPRRGRPHRMWNSVSLWLARVHWLSTRALRKASKAATGMRQNL